MNRRLHVSAIAPSWILPVATAALAIVVFVVDTYFTDLEIAISVFYIVPVLMSVFFLQKRGVMLVSAACMVLTVVSYLLTPRGEPTAGLVNDTISLLAIGVTTSLVLKIESKK